MTESSAFIEQPKSRVGRTPVVYSATSPMPAKLTGGRKRSKSKEKKKRSKSRSSRRGSSDWIQVLTPFIAYLKTFKMPDELKKKQAAFMKVGSAYLKTHNRDVEKAKKAVKVEELIEKLKQAAKEIDAKRKSK